MSAMTETWENTYSGFDRKAAKDSTGTVIRHAQHHLPAPVVSPTCRKKGHDWQEIPSLFPETYFPKSWTHLFGCSRCAKRGLVTLRTDGYERDASATDELGSSPEVSPSDG